MPWILLIKKVFSFIPMKLWISLFTIAISYFFVMSYGNTKYREGVETTETLYFEQYQKRLEQDLVLIKKELEEARKVKDRSELLASQTRSEVIKYETTSKQLQKEIQILRSKNIDCRNIDPEYLSLLQSITKPDPK